MKKLFVCLSLLCIACSFSFGQTDEDKGRALALFRYKIHQLEIYNMVLPCLMRKDQLKPIIRKIEAIREKEREVLDAEYKIMLQFKKSVDDAIAAAQKGSVPGQQLVDNLYKATVNSQMTDRMLIQDGTDEIFEVLKTTLDKGQLAVMANSLNPKDFPNEMKKPEEVTQDERIRLFIRSVLLDPDAYDVLVKLSVGS